MRPAAFVLAGGQSTRMGADKALLPWRGRTLLESIASAAAEVASLVAVIGDSGRYARFGYPVFPDCIPGCGPLSGLHTILQLDLAEWNLVLACDMPSLSAILLQTLICVAETAPAPVHCVVPVTNQHPEPLCALYHRSCRPLVESAMSRGCFKMRDLLSHLDGVTVAQPSPVPANLNTPADWADFQASHQ